MRINYRQAINLVRRSYLRPMNRADCIDRVYGWLKFKGLKPCMASVKRTFRKMLWESFINESIR